MDSKVSNGASPQDERTTSLLVFAFLQSCPRSRCHQELEVLGHELPVRAAHDDELQTDGNWCSHFREGAAETGQEAVPGGRAGTTHAALPCGRGPREDPAPADHARGQKGGRPLASFAPRCLSHHSDLHQPEPSRLREELSPKRDGLKGRLSKSTTGYNLRWRQQCSCLHTDGASAT
ncbi:BH3-interacting domain death agonist isoform X3 [Balaenoptera acutorostrata]|uniref:BH3-interacting domain death agonist n=1 Tax=Balaenoptera acutorostrata TaxID=9767 RepID=A0ABM3UDC7_BALAC|nr:BH3-interacting domain death agonist isoform X3 [Balaenoptera acutorostrata]